MPIPVVDALKIVQICNEQCRSLQLRMCLHAILEGGLIQQASQRIPLCQKGQALIHLVDFPLLGQNGNIVMAIGQGNCQGHNSRTGKVNHVSVRDNPASQKHKCEIGAPVHKTCQLCRHKNEYRYAQYRSQIKANLRIWISNQIISVDTDMPQQEKQHGSVLNTLIDGQMPAAKYISEHQIYKCGEE